MALRLLYIAFPSVALNLKRMVSAVVGILNGKRQGPGIIVEVAAKETRKAFS